MIGDDYIKTCIRIGDVFITNHSEISGIVFEDIDGNGKVGQKESGVKGVIITLEDGTKAVTDDSGRYFFRKAEAGKHMVTLDINSLPAAYFPAVPLYKEIELGEGMSFKYDIPLKKAEK